GDVGLDGRELHGRRNFRGVGGPGRRATGDCNEGGERCRGEVEARAMVHGHSMRLACGRVLNNCDNLSGHDTSRPKPESRASTIARPRLSTSSLANTLVRWLRTVFSDRPSVAAI